MTLEPHPLSDIFATLLSFGPCLDSYNSKTITDIKLKFLLFKNIFKNLSKLNKLQKPEKKFPV